MKAILGRRRTDLHDFGWPEAAVRPPALRCRGPACADRRPRPQEHEHPDKVVRDVISHGPAEQRRSSIQSQSKASHGRRVTDLHVAQQHVAERCAPPAGPASPEITIFRHWRCVQGSRTAVALAPAAGSAHGVG